MEPNTQELAGRGQRDGARMFRDWFSRLSEAPARGEKSAYVFVMGSLAELLRCFDLHTIFPEINSLQTAVRRVAHDFLNAAEDYGYSPDICGYVKADVTVQLRGGEHPMGRIPKPDLAVLTNACNTYIKWAEVWERFHKVPTFVLDVPGTRGEGLASNRGTDDFARDKRYVAGQLRELIALCEKVSGRPFDVDRLRETLRHSNAAGRAWRRVLETNRASPGPFNAMGDGTVFLGVLNAFRGAPEGTAYFEDLLEEMNYKAANRLGTVSDERYRLIFVGVPCYPIFRRFGEMFSQRGGTFIHSTYLLFASGGANVDFEYDLSDPLDALAEGTLLNVRDAMDSMFFPVERLARVADEYRADGAVFHPIKSCRTTSTGMADIRRALMARRDIPSLLIESDMMDRRVVAEAQMKNRIDAFFEGIDARRAMAAAH